ncbi:MAG: lysine--tRNA ligase [Deltaproteobacteria bacterium]|nr:lysine--tRNA ligase [Deltaproteobacteria bacterium]MBI3388120.1 lysine--tRNA ligase [Deltaproteobacteria bacterium]
MFWTEEVARRVSGPQIVNDSKTPSGRVHVGALRGVIIHDAVFRALQEHGVPARYLFGVDDYDPLDEIPAGQAEHFTPFLGAPLCNVPAPPGSHASDVAEHFIGEFFAVFAELGVRTEQYRMRDVYRSGRFNEAIDTILQHAAVVRRIYREVSGSKRAENWYPFQVICERCGRVGTTEVTAYEGGEVVYTCRPDLVTWARGCEYRGKVSPFDGRGKLPWKLEWTAKWKVLGVTIEGAGKDHNTKGGSRDVGAACLREIFGQAPPTNIPYEFFLVGGAKMSSSRGVGVSAREVATLLPAEVLRFLMIRTKPNQPVNFAADEKNITKLFSDFDRTHWRSYHDPKVTEDEKHAYLLSEVQPEGDFYEANFQLVLALLQLPHLLDLEGEVAKRKGAPLTDVELRHLQRRVATAAHWLEFYASEDEKIVLQQTLPSAARGLRPTQVAFLHRLALALESAAWDEDALQQCIFAVARLTPIEQPQAFQAVYLALLARDSGPKAGNLLAFLDRNFVTTRLRELPYGLTEFWTESGITREQFEAWTAEHKSGITAIDAELALAADTQAVGVIEFKVTLNEGKTHMKRVLFETFDGVGDFQERAAAYIQALVKDGLPIAAVPPLKP